MTSSEKPILSTKTELDDSTCSDSFLFESNGLQVPARIQLSHEHKNRMVVLFNGAVNRGKAPDPRFVFQRSSWAEHFNAHTLNIADPTLQPTNNLSIGWGQAGGENRARHAYAEIINWAANALNIHPKNIVLYGSSAGGFQALHTAPHVRDAKCVVNNPQIDWTYYFPAHVNKLIQEIYPNQDVETLRKDNPSAVSVVNSFSQEKYAPDMTYLLNAASRTDYNDQAPHLFRYLKNGGHLGSRKCTLVVYSAPKTGHNPLPKNRTIDEINKALDAS